MASAGKFSRQPSRRRNKTSVASLTEAIMAAKFLLGACVLMAIASQVFQWLSVRLEAEHFSPSPIVIESHPTIHILGSPIPDFASILLGQWQVLQDRKWKLSSAIKKQESYEAALEFMVCLLPFVSSVLRHATEAVGDSGGRLPGSNVEAQRSRLYGLTSLEKFEAAVDAKIAEIKVFSKVEAYRWVRSIESFASIEEKLEDLMFMCWVVALVGFLYLRLRKGFEKFQSSRHSDARG